MTDTNIVSWAVDGKRYDVDLFDIDGVEWRDIKRATRESQFEVLRLALDEKDFEAIGALLWVWRRREEPDLTYETVLSGLTYRDLANTPVEESSSPPV